MDQAEQLRNIVKLQNQRSEKNARVITITSGKGGVGKSNTAVNLAYQLQELGKKVIIFDADFGLANVEVMFGAIPKYNLSDLIFKGKSITEIITEGPNGIGFISGGSGIAALSNLNREQISYLIRNLAYLDQMADFIIIDTGAGISDSVMDFVLASPETIMVSTHEPSSLMASCDATGPMAMICFSPSMVTTSCSALKFWITPWETRKIAAIKLMGRRT